jgi:hypothetical protein
MPRPPGGGRLEELSVPTESMRSADPRRCCLAIWEAGWPIAPSSVSGKSAGKEKRLIERRYASETESDPRLGVFASRFC